MGVTFSDSIDDEVNARRAQEDRGGGLFEKDSISRNKLRMGKLEAKKLVEAYGHHCFLPVTGRDELWSLFSTALGTSFESINIVFCTAWEAFSKDDLCKTQEVLACICLISEADWRTRLSCIFDIFKSSCTEEIFYEDITLGIEVVTHALLQLWDAELTTTSQEELHMKAEEISTAAFDKLGKNQDEGIVHDDFVTWATEKFKESRTIANEEALFAIYNGI